MLIVSLVRVHSQDVHFSQFDRANLISNPALTAVGEEDARYSAQLKRQWKSGLGLPYFTKMVSYEHKVNPCDKKAKHKFSYGLNFINDAAGDSRLQLNQLNSALSYTYQFEDEINVSFGLSGAFHNRAFRTDALTWDEFWDDVSQSANLSLNTTEPINNFQVSYGSIGAGFNFHGKQSQLKDENGVITRQGRSTLDFGVGVHNINRPKVAFMDNDESKINVRYSIYMIPVIELNDAMDLKFKAFTQFQNPYFEAILSGGMQFHINREKKKKDKLSVGFATGFRLWSFNNNSVFDTSGAPKQIFDAIIPEITTSYSDWELGFSFDITVSKFQAPNNSRGGPELMIRRKIFKCYKVPPYKPNCKIY